MRFDLAEINGKRAVIDTGCRPPRAAMTFDDSTDEHQAWAIIGILNTSDLSIYDGQEPF